MTLLWVWEVWKAQANLDQLYWLRDNFITRSGFEGIMIPYAEDHLHQRTIELMGLATSLAIFSVGSLLVSKYASKKHIATSALLLLILLVLVPLPATARLDVNTLIRCYARVEMHVPANPSVGDLVAVTGYIKPMPNTLNRYWVCYHIGVGFPSLYAWIGAGVTPDVDVGNVAYIEWRIDGEYHQVFGSDITWYHSYFTRVEIINNLWTAHVWDSDETSMVPEEVCLPLPLSGEYVLSIAGGESSDTENTMSAVFTNVSWTTSDDIAGLWDGSVFDCEVIEEVPYDVAMISPYYKFMVLGGDPDDPPNPPDDDDNDGGGGGWDMYPVKLSVDAVR